jgi:hypothetical protein
VTVSCPVLSWCCLSVALRGFPAQTSETWRSRKSGRGEDWRGSFLRSRECGTPHEDTGRRRLGSVSSTRDSEGIGLIPPFAAVPKEKTNSLGCISGGRGGTHARTHARAVKVLMRMGPGRVLLPVHL